MIVKGQDAVFNVDTGAGIFQPVCCARNISVVTSADLGETSTLGTGIWKTYKQVKMSFSISAGGLVSFDMNYSIAELRQRQINGDSIAFQFLAHDKNGLQEQYTGNFIITSISTPASYNTSVEYSMEGQGTGTLTVTQAQPSATNTIYYGLQATNATPTDFSKSISTDPNHAITINYGAQQTPQFFWMAHIAGPAAKTKWQDNNEPGNSGTIGAASDLYEVRTPIKISTIDYTLYITRYVTSFADPDSVKYF
jgi:predicted secreted protein